MKSGSIFALLVLFGATPAIRAADAVAPKPENKWSLALTNDIVSSDYFRGYQRMDNGFIDQPAATLYYNAYSTENVQLTAFAGNWNTFDSNQEGIGSNRRAWFESDTYIGATVEFNHFVLTPTYMIYTYPQSGHETVQEFGFKLQYEDPHLLPISLRPFLGYYSEFNGSNTGSHDEGTYAEIGIEPVVNIGDTKIMLTFPVKLGLSLDGYYRDSSGRNSFFGYASFGVDASVPLPIDHRFGHWRVHGGVSYLQLLSDSTRASNGGDPNDFVGTFGVSVLF